jgi:hypothetical protein
MTEQDYLDYVSSLSSEEFCKLQIKTGLSRWTDNYKFPEEMYRWFQAGISKHRGDAWENEFVAFCKQLGPKTHGDHDATLDDETVDKNGLRGALIEIKFFTSMLPDPAKQIEKRGWALPWGERALRISRDADNSTGWAPPKKGTWQQVKPTCADYGLFSALHGNGAIHYWVPYHLISQKPGKKNVEIGKVPLGIQHRGHEHEGQVDIKSRFHELFFLDITEDTPFLSDLSKYDLSKYEKVVY